MGPIDTAKADARNALVALAIRAERDHPVAAACLLECRVPALEDGVLSLSYGPDQRFPYKKLKPLVRDLARYTDHEVRLELIEA